MNNSYDSINKTLLHFKMTMKQIAVSSDLCSCIAKYFTKG